MSTGLELVADALRTNDPRLVASALGDFAGAHLDDHAWRHGVLKALFMGVPIDVVARLDDRADDELARMAAGLVAERRAAGARSTTHARRDDASPPPPPLHHLVLLHDPRREATMRIFDPHIHMSRARPTTTRDVRGRRAGSGRALVLARAAAHERGHLRRLLRRADRLGAVPRRAVRHPAPLHDRLNPKEANDPVAARCSTCCRATCQGRRRRGRRTRLRLDDRRGGRGLRRTSSRWPSPSSSRRWCTRRTATRRRHDTNPRRGQRVGHRPRARRGRPPQRDDGRRGRRSGCWMGFSIYPDTKMASDRMVASCRSSAPSAMLVNSAADWGNSDP